MTATLNQIFDRLGRLDAKVDAIAEQNEHAADSRAQIYKKLDDLTLRTTHLEKDVLSVKNIIKDDIKPVTDEVQVWKQRGMGALAVAGLAGTALGGAAVWFWQQILLVIRGG